MSKSSGNVIDPIHVIQGISLEKLIENVTSNTNISLHEVERYVFASFNLT
jgi:valyl-tRNA synthetase